MVVTGLLCPWRLFSFSTTPGHFLAAVPSPAGLAPRLWLWLPTRIPTSVPSPSLSTRLADPLRLGSVPFLCVEPHLVLASLHTGPPPRLHPLDLGVGEMESRGGIGRLWGGLLNERSGQSKGRKLGHKQELWRLPSFSRTLLFLFRRLVSISAYASSSVWVT